MLTVSVTTTLATDERFGVTHFPVDGKALLPPANVKQVLAPLATQKRAFTDIQLGIKALHGAHVTAG